MIEVKTQAELDAAIAENKNAEVEDGNPATAKMEGSKQEKIGQLGLRKSIDRFNALLVQECEKGGAA